MPARISYADEYAAAFTASMDYERKANAARQFYSEFPQDDRDILSGILDRVWDRASRVKYITESNPGWFVSKDKLQCPEGGNALYFNWLVAITDEDGNTFERNFHVTVMMEKRIGQTLDAAKNDLLIQVRDKYFAGKTLPVVGSSIHDMRLTNVKCLAGGEG